jgi:anaerobic selenocysteine-containing dehydrogenase
MADLADRLGYGHLFPQNQDEILEYVLKGSGFSPEDAANNEGIISLPRRDMVYRKWEKGMLRPDGRPGFNTESGKFEITSSLLKEFGYPALPLYREPVEGPLSRPDMLDNYPLVFNSGSRVRSDFRSQFHGVESLVRENPEPLVWIHSLDAAQRHIGDGDPVRVLSPRGEVEMRARVTDDIARGSIDASMGGGGPASVEAWKDSNINECTDMGNFDPISGFPVYKALLCQVEKVEAS